jgi:hypothetical protein
MEKYSRNTITKFTTGKCLLTNVIPVPIYVYAGEFVIYGFSGYATFSRKATAK